MIIFLICSLFMGLPPGGAAQESSSGHSSDPLFALTFQAHSDNGIDTGDIKFYKGRSIEYSLFLFCQKDTYNICTESSFDTLLQAAREAAVGRNLVDTLAFGFPLNDDSQATKMWQSYREGQSEVQIAHPACLKVTPKEAKCNHMRLLGDDSQGGAYGMCFDEEFWPQKTGSSCLVYTAGIYNDSSFEMDLVKLGCIVHSYDPDTSAQAHIKDVMRHNRDPMVSTNFHYHNHGVGDLIGNNGNFAAGLQSEKMSSILTNGYTSLPQEIAMLKIDIEGSERGVLTDLLEFENGILLDSIQQICLEWHWEPLYVGGSLYDLFVDLNRIIGGLTNTRHSYRMFYRDNRRSGHLLVTCFKKTRI